MPMYYWESPRGCGEFKAKNDNEALRKLPKTATFMYKESNTRDGLPFITVYEEE